jgi:hypothetical protein
MQRASKDAKKYLKMDEKSVFYYDSSVDSLHLAQRTDAFWGNYEKCAKISKLYGAFQGYDEHREKIDSRTKHFEVFRALYDEEFDFRPYFDDETFEILKKQPYAVLLAFNNEKVHIEQGYFYLIDQWFKHMQRVKLDTYVIFVASSVEECQLVQHMAACIVHDGSQSDFRYEDTCEKCIPLAADFRWLYVDALLGAGKELVILSDADAFFLKDPIPYFLDSRNTIFGLSDRDKDQQTDLEYCKGDNLCISTGFVAFKQSVSEAVEMFVDFLYDKGGWEQKLFNDFFSGFEDCEELELYSRMFSFGNLKDVVQVIQSAEGAMNLAVVHAGGTHGKDKVKQFQCAQLWLY